MSLQHTAARQSWLRTLGYLVLSIGVFVLCFYLATSTLRVPPNDFLLVAWSPGRQLLEQGAIDLAYPYPLWTPLLMLPLALGAPETGAPLWLLVNFLLLGLAPC